MNKHAKRNCSMETRNKNLKYIFVWVLILLFFNNTIAAQKRISPFELENNAFTSKCNGDYIVIGKDYRTIAHFKKGKKNGQWVTIFKDLNNICIETYKNGEKHGLYSSSGNLGGISGYYKNNLKDGRWEEGSDVGDEIKYYKKGILNGIYISTQGDYSIKGYYKDGKKHGKWITSENDKIESIKIYKNGVIMNENVSE